MQSIAEKPMTTDNHQVRRVDPWGVVLVLAISALVGLLYVPLLHWLGHETLHTQQLLNGAMLVVLALAFCVQDVAGKLRFAPQISNEGIGLILLALLCLLLAARWLPLLLVSACFAFAGVVAFLFGKNG